MHLHPSIPVLTIDGPSGSGKGTVSRLLAIRLGWRFLDSGALYRAIGYAAWTAGLDLNDAQAVIRCARAARIDFSADPADTEPRVWLNEQEVGAGLRTEAVAAAASRVAAMPSVRQTLLKLQWRFFKPPGLVADGRDMGTVVFPAAPFKIFLTASVSERAKRRYNQLKEKGIEVTMASLKRDIKARDSRDVARTIAPLKPAIDAIWVDATHMSVADVVTRILAVVQP